MTAVTVVFDKTWLKNQLADGVRVVRKLEKWVAETPGCKLKSSGPEQLVVEVEDDRQAEFIAQLEAELRVNYAVEEPAEVFSFSSKEVVKADSPAADGAKKKLAVNGMNNPTVDYGGESSEQISSTIEHCRNDDMSQTTGTTGVPPVDARCGKTGTTGVPPVGARCGKTGTTGVPPVAELVPNGQDARCPSPSSAITEHAATPIIDPEKATNVFRVLASLIRQVPLCHCKALVDYFKDTMEVVPMLMHMNALDSFWRMCPLLSIDSGYGLSAFLYELAELYAALELTKGVNEKSVLELNIGVGGEWGPEFGDWESAVSMAKDMRRFNSRNGGGRPILCLKIAAWQNRLTEPRVKEYLRQLNAMAVNFTLVFAIPFVETQTLNSIANALGDVFDIRTLAVPPTGTPKLLEYAKNELAKRSFTLDDNVNEVLEQWVLDEKRDDSFFGYKTMEKLVNRIIYDKALGNCRSGRLDRVIAAADLQGYGVAAGPDGDPWAELNGLVGLGEVKRRVEEVVAQIKAQRKLAGKGRKVSRPAIHMLFTGNPGTGKTTVARIVARILKREGILRKGHLLEVRGRDLCGEYIGQTAPKTSALCRDAYGSVLFIDEAYSLFRGDGNDHDYGREALDTLVAEMENHRDDLCVILAGYTDDMKAMLEGNEGLASRIPFTVEFPDYSRDEMSQIFFTMAKDGFDCEPNLEQAVKEYFNAIPDEALKQKGFSNARFVRNLYERTWGKAAYRSRMDDDDIKLLVSDLSGATEEREFKQLVEKAPRRAIGFGN